MNSFGNKFKVTIFGESHGPLTGIVIDGVKPGMKLRALDFAKDLRRRRDGDIASLAKCTSARKEKDIPQIVSGLYKGYTTGAPLTIVFANEDTRSEDYAEFRTLPRPSHADFAADRKYEGFNDIRGGGMFSGRMTLPLVAAGTVARKMLAQALPAIRISARIKSIGGSSETRLWSSIIETAAANQDSVGGCIECTASGIPVGVGEPFFDSLESQIAHLAFSVPGVKAISFGDGAECGAMYGSDFNDHLVDTDGQTDTNHNGGINGGITNGNPIVFQVQIRPTASISQPQATINLSNGQPAEISIRGRHDTCIALRCPVIIESVAAIALADLLS